METYPLHLCPLGLFDKWTKIDVPRLLAHDVVPQIQASECDQIPADRKSPI
jgi:hypothetical protein